MRTRTTAARAERLQRPAQEPMRGGNNRPGEVAALMQAAAQLQPADSIRPLMYATLFGLLGGSHRFPLCALAFRLIALAFFVLCVFLWAATVLRCSGCRADDARRVGDRRDHRQHRLHQGGVRRERSAEPSRLFPCFGLARRQRELGEGADRARGPLTQRRIQKSISRM